MRPAALLAAQRAGGMPAAVTSPTEGAVVGEPVVGEPVVGEPVVGEPVEAVVPPPLLPHAPSASVARAAAANAVSRGVRWRAMRASEGQGSVGLCQRPAGPRRPREKGGPDPCSRAGSTL